MNRERGIAAFLGLLLLLLSLRGLDHLRVRRALSESAQALRPETREILRELKSPVEARVFLSRQMPAAQRGTRQALIDLLHDLRDASEGRFRFRLLDPDDPIEGAERRRYGLPVVRIPAKAGRREQSVTAGIVLHYGSQLPQTIPFALGRSDLELRFAIALCRLLDPSPRNIAFVSDHGGPIQRNAFRQLIERELRSSYTVEAVPLAKALPPRVRTVIVAAPDKPFVEDELARLDAHLARGGSLMVMTPATRIARGDSRELPLASLRDWLGARGLVLGRDLVFDRRCESRPYMDRGAGRYHPRVAIPVRIRANGEGADPGAAAKGLAQLYLPFSSSVSIDPARLPKGAAARFELTSSPRAWTDSPPFDLRIVDGKLVEPAKPKERRVGLIASLRLAPRDGGGRIVLAGTDAFAQDAVTALRPDNLRLVAALVDWLSIDERLVAIRSRRRQARPLTLGPKGRHRIELVNLFLLPMLLAGIGLIQGLRQSQGGQA